MTRCLTFLCAVIFLLAACETDNQKGSGSSEGVVLQPTIITDIIYGHDFGIAMTLDVYLPQEPNGAGIILINSGGWHSPYDTFKTLDAGVLRLATDEEMDATNSWHILNPRLLISEGFTVFEVRHGSAP